MATERIPAGLASRPKRGLWIALGAFLLAAAFPLAVRNDYIVHIASFVLYYMIASASLDLVAGFLGEISFGHAGFLAVGAYTTAILNMKVFPDTWPGFWIALVLGGFAAAAAGVLVGIPALRISGQYFFMVTMGFGEIIRFILLNWQGVTNGSLGIAAIPPPRIGEFWFVERSHYFYLFLAVLVLTLVPVYFLRNSRFGRAWIAIREDPIAAEAMGIRLTSYKVIAFAVSAFFAGIAGGLLGGYLGFLHPSNFLATESILVLVMVLLGGPGLIYGALVGALLMTILGEALRPLAELRMLIVGGIMVLLMILKPRGLLGK